MDFSLCSNEKCGLGETCYRRKLLVLGQLSPHQSVTRFEPYGERLVLSKIEGENCFGMASVPAFCNHHKDIPEQRLDLKGVVR